MNMINQDMLETLRDLRVNAQAIKWDLLGRNNTTAEEKEERDENITWKVHQIHWCIDYLQAQIRQPDAGEESWSDYADSWRERQSEWEGC